MARNKTLDAQLNALHSERLAALDVFAKSASILEETSEAYQDLADQAYEEAQLKLAVADTATEAGTDAWLRAFRIRELVG